MASSSGPSSTSNMLFPIEFVLSLGDHLLQYLTNTAIFSHHAKGSKSCMACSCNDSVQEFARIVWRACSELKEVLPQVESSTHE